jgi:RimJ/RimL family protein N-acetyltransferase
MSTTYFLTTERLGFRTWAIEDLPLALALWGDPEVMRLIVAGGQLSAEQVRERLLREIATQAEHGVQYWPVFLLSTGGHLGCCGLRSYRLDQGVYEIGVHLCRAHWGQGYAKEAAQAVLAYAFGPVGARALFAGHHPNNMASRRLLSQLGFRYTHDEFYPPMGMDHPSYLLSAEEFAAQRKA